MGNWGNLGGGILWKYWEILKWNFRWKDIPKLIKILKYNNNNNITCINK